MTVTTKQTHVIRTTTTALFLNVLQRRKKRNLHLNQHSFTRITRNKHTQAHTRGKKFALYLFTFFCLQLSNIFHKLGELTATCT